MIKLEYDYEDLRAAIAYYVIITLGYVWAFVQLPAGEPFDALVLFIVTFSFQTYRNEIRKLMREEES